MTTAEREAMIFTLHHCYGWSSIDLYKLNPEELIKVYNAR